MSKIASSSKTKARTPRSDGAETRAQILEAAGKLFAAKGYARTTSKEICESAGTNIAAVNYHFGDKDGLYAEVLEQAHAQLVQLSDLEAIQRSALSHEDTLHALIRLFFQGSSRSKQSWGLSVLVQELLAPSDRLLGLIQSAILPKMRVLRLLVSEILELPPDHPAVQRGLALIVSPCVMMTIAPQDMLKHAMPELDAQPERVVSDMVCYAIAGLKALKERYKSSVN